MTYFISVDHPSGCPWISYPPGGVFGREVTTLDAVTAGDVVMSAQTIAGFDENVESGPSSKWDVVELPDTGVDGDVVFYGFFGIATKTAAANGKTNVVWGPCTVDANVYDVAATAYVNGQGLVVDFAGTPSRLITPAATGDNPKVVARIARAYTGLTAGENILRVDFAGIFGFGNVNTIA